MNAGVGSDGSCYGGGADSRKRIDPVGGGGDGRVRFLRGAGVDGTLCCLVGGDADGT